MREELVKWGAWFRDNSDKFLVAACGFGLLLYNLHILHHSADTSQLQFVNSLVNNLQGAFLTLVTGAALRNKTTATSTTKDPSTGEVTAASVAKEEDK